MSALEGYISDDESSTPNEQIENERAKKWIELINKPDKTPKEEKAVRAYLLRLERAKKKAEASGDLPETPDLLNRRKRKPIAKPIDKDAVADLTVTIESKKAEARRKSQEQAKQRRKEELRNMMGEMLDERLNRTAEKIESKIAESKPTFGPVVAALNGLGAQPVQPVQTNAVIPPKPEERKPSSSLRRR